MSYFADHLRADYALMQIREEAAALPRAVDRDKARAISQAHGQQRKRVAREHERNKIKRVDQMVRALATKHRLNLKAIQKAKTPELRAQRDKLHRIAAKQVRDDHTKRMTTLMAREIGELRLIITTAQERAEALQHAEQKPKLITDARHAPERQILKPKL